jgi:FkbM family methyltransferase
MSYEDFLDDEQYFGCCVTSTGGVPLDKTLKKYLKEPSGIFIESGAYDGLSQSNTAIFEMKYGWTGVLIEPSANLQSSIRSNRPNAIVIHAALVSSEMNGTRMTDPGGKPDGTSSPGGEVQGRSISSILDEFAMPHVDFWSLDVEGAELDALHGMDFARHRPSWILIEIWDANPRVFAHMAAVRYELVDDSSSNDGSISGWTHPTRHRDFLFRDALARCPAPAPLAPAAPAAQRTAAPRAAVSATSS